MSATPVRVRFAPSPTGFLHIGGLRTALYNELFARKNNGIFILRIEDTDRTRLVEGGIENIIRTLHSVGVVPDEGPYLTDDGSVQERGAHGPYIQSERSAIYREHIERLVADGKAYRCFCTSERLDEVRKAQMAAGHQIMYDKKCRDLSADDTVALLSEGAAHVIRLAVPPMRTIGFTDLIRGEVRINTDSVDDQVLMKSDGYPTYHLANVIDDHLMEVTHVIRGEEWIPSTPKHVLLYEAFGWEAPAFTHLPLLLNPDRSKLSKRQGDVAVEDYLVKGYLPEALVNFVALLGWNPSSSQEIYAKDDLAASFDITKVNKGGAVFNTEKLEWMNGEYMKTMDIGRLAALTMPYLEATGLVTPEGDTFHTRDGREVDAQYVAGAVALEQQRARTLAEIPDALTYLFDDVVVEEGVAFHWKKSDPQEAKRRLDGLHAFIGTLAEEDVADKVTLEQKVIAHIADNGWSNADTLWPMRVALSGRKASPGPFELAAVLGKGLTLERIAQARDTL